jgi:hypothetical protein
MKEYRSSLSDSNEAPVFWLALAVTGWRLGRLDEDVRQKALKRNAEDAASRNHALKTPKPGEPSSYRLPNDVYSSAEKESLS